MEQEEVAHKRRYLDLAPLEGSEAFKISRIKADASIGGRHTDKQLKKRYTKADAPNILTDLETKISPHELMVSRTDPRGTITYCNDVFTRISGWSREELLGSNHNLIRHPDMPKIAFKLAWDILHKRQDYYGYLKNLRKDGGYYWVFAYITPELDKNGNIIGYTSYRRFAPKLAVKTVTPLYEVLHMAEKKIGIEFSKKLFKKYLKNQGYTHYDQFIVELQVKANASLT